MGAFSKLFSRLRITSDPNVGTQTSSVIQADSTNSSLVLAPNGTGALVANIPDGTATGGNARGTNAVDLQMKRTLFNQVASGVFSTISGGQSNIASAPNATVIGGQGNQSIGEYSVTGGAGNIANNSYSIAAAGNGNTASGAFSTVSGGNVNNATAFQSTVGGGAANTASGQNSVVSGGNSNTASSNFSTVSGGQTNTASTNTHATVVGGQSNLASGFRATVLGGFSNTASGAASLVGGDTNTATNTQSFAMGFASNATGSRSAAIGNGALASQLTSFAFGFFANANASYSVALGYRSNTYLLGQLSISGNSFGAANDMQQSSVVANREAILTTGATTVLSLDGTGTTNLIIPNSINRSWNVKINYVAVVTVITGTATGVTVGDTKSQNIEIGFKRVGGTSSLVGAGSYSIAQEDASMNTATLVPTAGALQELALTFTGPTFAGGGSVTCRVVAKVELVEVAW